MYLMIGTRPDLAAAVGVMSQFATARVQLIGRHSRGSTDTFKELRHTASRFKRTMRMGSKVTRMRIRPVTSDHDEVQVATRSLMNA